ncbi:MAG: AhpC/TSA family protein [Acidimicrobiales bacterium]
MRDHRDALEAAGATAMAVGFSPAEALAALAQQLGWPWPFLADPQRVLYARLGLDRAPLHRVFTPGAVRRYREAAAAGTEVHRPVEDARQLGADAVVAAGRVLWLRRQAGPDDRPAPGELLAAVAAARDALGGAG